MKSWKFKMYRKTIEMELFWTTLRVYYAWMKAKTKLSFFSVVISKARVEVSKIPKPPTLLYFKKRKKTEKKTGIRL